MNLIFSLRPYVFEVYVALWCTAGTWLSNALPRSASPSPPSPRSTEASCSAGAPRRLSSCRTQSVILRTFPRRAIRPRRRRRPAGRVRSLLSSGSRTLLCMRSAPPRVVPGPCSGSRSARDPKQEFQSKWVHNRFCPINGLNNGPKLLLGISS